MGLFKNDESLANLHKCFDNSDPFYIDHDKRKTMYDPCLKNPSIKFGDLSTMEFVKMRKRTKLKLKMLDEAQKEAEMVRNNKINDQETGKEYVASALAVNTQIDDSMVSKDLSDTAERLRQELVEINKNSIEEPTRPYIICLDSASFKFRSSDCYL